MARRMQFASRLMLLSVAGLIGCAGALGLSTPQEEAAPGESRAALRGLRLPPTEKVKNPCGVETQLHPQSPDYRGGDLENFRYFYADGNTVPPQALPGRVIGHLDNFGDVAVTLQPTDKKSCGTSDQVALYEVRVPTSDGKDINPCSEAGYERGPDESCSEKQTSEFRGLAIAVPGAWDEKTGEHRDYIGDKKVFTLSCMTGIVAKCVNWGYPPWGSHYPSGSHEPVSLADYYSACVHAARAEYLLGWSYTRKGTTIDIYDRLAIEEPSTASDRPLQFEAAWGKDGLLCIGAPRFPACRNSTEVEALSDCTEAALPWKTRTQWPAEVLLVTRSTSDNTTAGGSCPKSQWHCGNAD